MRQASLAEHFKSIYLFTKVEIEWKPRGNSWL